MAATPTTKPQASPGGGLVPGRPAKPGFWQRVTEGLELQELWKQFSAEARASYTLYSAEVDWEAVRQERRWKRPWRVVRSLFWAMLMKLSPARRVLLLAALLLALASAAGMSLLTLSRGDETLIATGLLVLLLALELAERVTMKRDLEIAREIQRWLVPEIPPRVPGVDIVFATRPANTVAGDYHDAFFPQVDGAGRGKLLLVAADVAGKGVPAALLMATFQASLHALAARAESLAELVEGMNRFACARSLGGLRFTTAFLAEFDPATRAVTYVNAGHNAPVLRRVTSGAVERLENGGLPFGIEPAAKYACGTTTLAYGDLLLIFTDGLVERVNEQGQEYGEEALLHLLNTVPGESAGETLRHLMADVDRFAGAARQQDDTTCLVVRAV